MVVVGLALMENDPSCNNDVSPSHQPHNPASLEKPENPGIKKGSAQDEGRKEKQGAG